MTKISPIHNRIQSIHTTDHPSARFPPSLRLAISPHSFITHVLPAEPPTSPSRDRGGHLFQPIHHLGEHRCRSYPLCPVHRRLSSLVLSQRQRHGHHSDQLDHHGRLHSRMVGRFHRAPRLFGFTHIRARSYRRPLFGSGHRIFARRNIGGSNCPYVSSGPNSEGHQSGSHGTENRSVGQTCQFRAEPQAKHRPR